MILPGFVGPAYQHRFLQANAEQCTNLYPETQQSPNASPKTILLGTPGTASVFSLPSPPTRGQFQQDGRSFAADGVGLYETTTGAAVLLGPMISDGRPVSFETNGSAIGAGGHQLFCVSAGHGYLYDLVSGVFSEITDPNFPIGQALVALYFDGFFLTVTPGYVYSSALENGLNWTGLAGPQRGAREIATDNMVSAVVNYTQHTLWLFGTKRTEIWYDTAASTFPFGPIPGVFLNNGLAAKDSLVRVSMIAPPEGAGVSDVLCWLGVSEIGTRQVYLSVNYQAMLISTHAIAAALATYPTVSDFVGWAYAEEGHVFYVLSSVANAVTWVYDITERLWHQRGYSNLGAGQFQQIAAWNHCISPTGQHWVGDALTGTIYQQALSIYADAGNPLRWVRRAPHLTNQLHRIFYPGLTLSAAMGQGLSSGQGSDPRVMLRWSDDGGETFGAEHWRSLGKQGVYDQRVRWGPLGSSRNRVFELSGSDPTPRALFAAWLDPDPIMGTS